MRIRTFLLLVMVLPVCRPVFGQQPPPPLPQRGPAPLLFVRFRGPQAMQATFYQGNVQGRSWDAPVTVGLRPGYSYRVKLSNLPKHPDVALYPTVQVCGVLNLPPNAAPDAYPVNVVLSQDDIEQALSGSLITKVFYIESTERAAPQAPGRDEVLEYDVGANRNPFDEALALGRPALVVYFGAKQLTPLETAQQNVPGTILQPGDKALPYPALPPCVPCLMNLYDPLHGPRLFEDECLHDGGDRGPRAAIGGDGKLYGVDPEDTVAEYTDASGRRSVVHSNRVCLCVPRFGVVRHVLPVGGYDTVLRLDDARGVRGQEQMQTKLPALTAQQFVQLKAMQGRDSVSCMEQSIGTTVTGHVIGGPEVIKATAETHDLTVSIAEAPVVLPERPLVLVKLADKQTAQVGEVVTFFLRYSNQGGKPIANVAVVDSLTTRLEYVPGSAQSDRNAVFTTQENEAGSTIVRWEITGTLQPGQSGVVRFQARIR